MNEKYFGFTAEDFRGFISAADDVIADRDRSVSHGREFIADENDRGLKFWSTSSKWEQYRNGALARKDVEKFAVRRMERKNAWAAKASLKRIVSAAEEDDVVSILIDVEWRKNHTYGNIDPYVRVQLVGRNGTVDFTEGHASGGNYDKLSSAVADAMNLQPMADRLFLRGKLAGAKNRNISYSDALPSLRRGVGIDSQIEAFEELGFRICDKSWSENGSYDYFYLKKEK